MTNERKLLEQALDLLGAIGCSPEGMDADVAEAKVLQDNIRKYLTAPAPAVREPQDERAAFEAWAKSIGLDLYSVIGSQDSANPFGGYTRYAYEAWQARAHGIGVGGK